ncbi:unnamed protein product [Phytophthora lilii]|uniref:Unnamed protein product n=1 Tax=Phytophthora lilii TaxID=2077276 RepID=A0A9W6TJJ8_9STRA|nr:unnamed protein product [Phytophthora lilii]
MLWGSSGNDSLGIGAYSFAPRDENASYYYYQEPFAPLTASASASAVSHTFGQTRGVTHAKKPPDKRQTKRTVGRNTRSLRTSYIQAAASDVRVDHPEVVMSGEPELNRHPPIIMCAGKSVYGLASDQEAKVRCNNNAGEDYLGGKLYKCPPHNLSTSFRSTATATSKTKKGSEQYSLPQHRTDEELEQIIRELRDQVFQLQHKQSHDQRQKLAPRSHCYVDTGNQTQKHHRKHLKNPIEKMQVIAATVPVAASISSSPMTPNGLLLQRPLSSSHLNRFVAESTLQMIVPAVIYEPPLRTGSRTSNSSSGGSRVSSLDFSSLHNDIPRSRHNSSSSYRRGEKPGEVSVNPRNALTRANQLPHSTRVRRDAEQARGHDHPGDSGDSYLYLVGVDDSEDHSQEYLSLSPVGPWVVHDFATSSATTDTPRSSSISTCYSVSSLGSDDIGNGGEWSNNELAAMSPRSRLLYISACADDNEASRALIDQTPTHQQALRQSSTCGSSLFGNTRRLGLESRTAPKRCSSAKARTRGNPRSGLPKSKATACRANPVRKRPQSGNLTSRSRHSDESVTTN